MAVEFLSLRPMRVLADRSRDVCSGYAMVSLAPYAIFSVTDNRKPINAQLLRDYDVLAIVGVSAVRYSTDELNAIQQFVRRGGTLILASSVGQFCWSTGKSAAELAHNAVAECFGYRFQEPTDLPADQSGLRGFEREQLEMAPAVAAMKLLPGDLPMNRPGWLDAPVEARVLVTGCAQKRPIVAWSEYGKGKVLVCHDTAMFQGWNAFIASCFLSVVDPTSRVKAKEWPIALIEYPEIVQRHGRIRLTMTEPTKSHASRVVKLARKVLPLAEKLMPPHKPIKEWSIGLETGCTGWNGWGDVQYIQSNVGIEQSDASLAAILAGQLIDRLLWHRFDWPLRTFVPTMVPFLVDHMLRELGFAQYADAQLEAIRNHPTFAVKVDFARVYSEVDRPASLKWLWFELAENFGKDVLSRMAKVLPEKDLYKHLDNRLYCELDIVAWVLAQVVGAKAYGFFRERGHTVREIPQAKAGTAQLGKAVEKSLQKLVSNGEEIASDRYDAACILADRLGEELKDDDKVAARLTNKAASVRLAAAIRLAQRRDDRCIVALKEWLGHSDVGLRALASLALVSECGDRGAANELVAAAPQMDTRLQLAAGYALAQIDDPRGAQWTFRRHPACSVKVHGRGQIRANPCVDGHEVCNVYSTPMVRPAQHGGGFSTYYVDWVHTHPRWRRRGIARVGMDAGLDWHWDRDCAMTSLHTGTRNVAHALYRDYGLADYWRGLKFEKALQKESVIAAPKGVQVSLVDGRAKLECFAFANQQQAVRPDHLREVGGWTERRVAVRAVQGGKVIGFAAANVNRDGKSAELAILATSEPKPPKQRKSKAAKRKKPGNAYSPREHVGQAVLSRLHAELAKRGVRKIESYYWRPFGEQDTAWLLRRSGYGTQLTGGVELYRLNSLEQFLKEIVPALEGRLAKAKGWRQWNGKLILRGGEQSACICVDHGRVSICPAESANGPAITITGPLPAIQRLAMGVTSAFDEFYQIQTTIDPMLNDQVTQLLDSLFPRVTLEA